MTDEELIARLRSQIGDDVQHVYDHEALFRISVDRIEALVKEQNYWIERCGRERAFASSHRVRAERLEAALQKLACKCPSNCDWEHDDICPSWIARAALKGEDHE